jgi:ubiquinone/menaquinone biosynthesis C-methylase UbiE
MEMSDPLRMWTLGDYPSLARRLLPIAIETLEALPVRAGTRVLDVATGDGNLAIEAARRGAVATGIDLVPALIDLAKARAEQEAFDVDFLVGDVQDLDVEDASFDVVVSVLGAMFAPDHERAMAEMARACRPGGAVANVVWSDQGWSAAFHRRAEGILPLPPAGRPHPDEWADLDEARRRFEAAGLQDVVAEVKPFEWHFATVDDGADFMMTQASPFVAFVEAAEGIGKGDEARKAIVGALSDCATTSTEGSSVTITHPYVLVTGTRP